MDYDYNNILGRLKFDLGQDSFFSQTFKSERQTLLGQQNLI